MDIKDIEDIAKQDGVDFCMYERAKLTDTGDGMMGFVESGKLTYYGESLVSFANAVEKATLAKAAKVCRDQKFGDMSAADEGCEQCATKIEQLSGEGS